MKRNIKIASTILFFVIASIWFLQESRNVNSAPQENQCFTCHTNAGKLIKITREIAQANKGKPGASVATEGEG